MKKSMFTKLLDVIDHNRYMVLSMVLFVAVAGTVLSTVGCQSTTKSLAGDGNVTRVEFSAEMIKAGGDLDIERVVLDKAIAAHNLKIQQLNALGELGEGDLDRKDAIRDKVFATLSQFAMQAASGGITPAGVATLGVGMIGLLGTFSAVGTAADNRRKDKLIKEVKDKA